MADEAPAQKYINVLLIAPHGVEEPPLDDIRTTPLTQIIQSHLGCDAIINTDYRKPTGSKPQKRNNGKPNVDAKVLDLNKIEQAKLHPAFIPQLKEIFDKKGSTYVFWIHGIDDENIKNGIECYVGCGQASTKARFTATQETIDGVLTQLNNVGIKTALAPEDSIYRGWSQDYMNQWFRIEGYTLEQAQSVQLEFKYTGIREKNCTQSAGIKIAKAISNLLSVPFLPMDAVDDEKIEKAYEHLKEIFVKHFQSAMLECGKYLIKTFYDDNYELAQKKKFTRNKSLSMLIKRIQKDATEKGDAPSRTWLYDAVNLAIDNHLCEQKLLPSVYGQLGHSHKVKLTSAPDEVKPALVQEAFEKEYTVAKLRERIMEEKKKAKSDESIDLFNLPQKELLMKQSTKRLNQLKGRAEVIIQTYSDTLKIAKLAEKRIKKAIETREPSPAELRKAVENNEWTVARNNVNFQTGCANACIYCYGRFMFNAEKLKQEAEAQGKVFNWGKTTVRKKDVEANYGLKDGRVGFPTSHDITPENLADYLTVLGKLLRAGNKILIITKPVLNCIQGICNASAFFKKEILFRFTITAKSSDVLKFWEPNAPSYEDRFECLKYAYEAGFQTSVSIEPMLEYPRAQEMVDEMLPYITDAVWFGKMNHIKSFDNPDDTLKAELEKVETGHSDDNIKALYEIYGDNPKIKWKLAYKDVLGIPLPPAPGMDI